MIKRYIVLQAQGAEICDDPESKGEGLKKGKILTMAKWKYLSGRLHVEEWDAEGEIQQSMEREEAYRIETVYLVA